MNPDISTALKEAKDAAIATVNKIASIEELLSSTSTEVTEEKKYSIDEIRTKLAALSNNGKKAAVKKILNKHGSARLSEIDPSDYESLMKDAMEIENA